MKDSGLTRVMLIGDDQSMLDALKANLEPHALEVFYAQSGLEGIRTTREVNPDVIILDLHVEEINDWAVCKNIRSFSKAPILVLSAQNKPGMVSRALDEGADDYLLKPTTSSVLIAHIRNLVRRARVEKSNGASKPADQTNDQ